MDVQSDDGWRVSRRRALGAAVGVGGAVALGVPGLATCVSGPSAWPRPSRAGAPPVAGLHLQFGADASSEVGVSWHTTDAVSRPRAMYGSPDGGLGTVRDAETVTYRDAQSGTEVRVHHARLGGLAAGSDYIYAAIHDGAGPELGSVRTAPRGRAPFTFTSFGDQATPTLGRQNGTAFVNDNLGSPAVGDVTSGVERIAPLFNLVNGPRTTCWPDRHLLGAVDGGQEQRQEAVPHRGTALGCSPAWTIRPRTSRSSAPRTR